MRKHNRTWLNRRYIVNSKMQVLLALHSVLLTVAIMAINLIFELKFADAIRTADTPNVKWIFAGAVTAIFFISIITGFWITNKIAGPIFRLRRHIQEIADGEKIQPLKFRKGDYFSEIIEPYNKILKRLKEYE